MIRRINILGGPCSGKSNFAAKLYSLFKTKKYNIELCREYVKNWVYKQKKPESFDQIFIFGKQLHEEFIPLNSGTDLIVTDCPLILSYYYSTEMNISQSISESIFNIIFEFEKNYPSINVLLEGSFEYVESGRFHTKQQADNIQESLKNILLNSNTDYILIDPTLEDSEEKIFEYYLEKKWSPYA